MSSELNQSTKETALNHLFGALSDPTRRAIVAKLLQGPAPIGEIARPFDMSLAAIGKHVRVLEAAGLVSRKVEGRVHLCTLNAVALGVADEWLTHYREYWSENLDALAEYVETMNDS